MRGDPPELDGGPPAGRESVAKISDFPYALTAWGVLEHAAKPNRNEPLEGIVMADSHVPENWCKIQDFPDYSVSNLGRVRRDSGGRGAKPGRILKPSKDANGYACVNLWREGIQAKHYIHRIVALAFLGDPPGPKRHVAHWDGDGMNAKALNLRWVTQSENEADKSRHGRANHAPKGARTISPDQLARARRRIASGASIRETAREMCLGRGALGNALKNGLAPQKYWRQ